MKTAAYCEAELARIAQCLVSLAPSRLSLPRVLSDAQTRSPDAHLEGIFFGSRTNAVLTIYMASAHFGDYTKTGFIYFDQQDATHLYTWRRGRNETPGDWLLWLLVPLHFGTSWGLGGKLAWRLMGLVLPIMAVTGFLMYWNRRPCKRMKL